MRNQINPSTFLRGNVKQSNDVYALCHHKLLIAQKVCFYIKNCQDALKPVAIRKLQIQLIMKHAKIQMHMKHAKVMMRCRKKCKGKKTYVRGSKIESIKMIFLYLDHTFHPFSRVFLVLISYPKNYLLCQVILFKFFLQYKLFLNQKSLAKY